MLFSSPDRRRSAGVCKSQDQGRRSAGADRRSRRNLRELCDEVLASYRQATDGPMLSDSERREAEAMLADLTPLPPR